MAEEFNTDSMLSTFLNESNKKLKKLENIILEKQNAGCFDDADINDIFRIMHTIKGLASVLMYENIANVAHKLEDVFYYLRELHSGDVMHKELIEMVLAVSDFIKGELSKIKNGNAPDGDESEIISNLTQFFDAFKSTINSQEREMSEYNKNEDSAQFYITSLAEEDSRFYKIVIYYEDNIVMSNIRAYSVTYALKKIALDIIYTPEDILSNDSSADVILSDGFYILLKTRAEREEIMSLIDHSDTKRIDFNEISASEYKKCLAELGREEDFIVVVSDDERYSSQNEQNPIVPGDYIVRTRDTGKRKTLEKNWCRQQTGINVDDEKMDALMELVRKLVNAKDNVLQNNDLKVPGLDLGDFQKASEQLSNIIAELQDVVVSMRMIPLANVFQKMKRIVSDVSKELDKEIEFEVIGENIEVDKKIIEYIYDPLVKLIRNAVDHGIENDIVERVERGKPLKGKVILEAKNDGNNVYISVMDDGNGLNKESIYKKALADGFIENKPISEFQENEIFHLITLPGFSTKESVTEYSGKGVGMNIVVKNIQSVGGKLEIASVEGEGTKMVLVIPILHAVTNDMII